ENPMRMRSNPASGSRGFASSHSNLSRVPASESSNAFSTSLEPARSAAGVDPHPLAVAHDHLVDGLGIGPAEAPRALEHEAALGLLQQLALAAVDFLL